MAAAGPTPTVLRKFREMSSAAALAADDAECSALMRTAEHYAADLFSSSAHYAWARGKTSGADILRLCILGKLDAFRERAMQKALAQRGVAPVDRNRGTGDEV